MPRSPVALFTLVVVACASPQAHTPIPFEPHFPVRPASHFSPSSVFEIQALESLPELSPLEKKRLLDLYQLEMKQLKPGSERRLRIAELAERLQAETAPLEQELKQVLEENNKVKDPSSDERPLAVFSQAALRREYLDAYQLWNKDKNEQALDRITRTLRNPSLRERATKGEWTKLMSLRLRIAMDVGVLETATTAYEEMKAFEPCGAETAQAGFLLSLYLLSAGDGKGALRTFDAQCDADASPSNRIRRLYWRGRFREAAGEPGPVAYAELLKSRVPGYYLYFAMTRLGQKIDFPEMPLGRPSYLATPLQLPPRAHQLLISAEDRLKANLRRDAAVYLRRATRILREELTPQSLKGLLYVAHLMESAGTPLDAMKIYTVVTTELLGEKPELATFPLDFLPEMFPRPHAPLVESLSRQWSVDPDFIYAIMRQESAFNPGAVSVADARGLMQLMPALARSLSRQWSYNSYYADRLLFNAEENLKLAVFHLHQLLRLAPHPALVAASYNAGMARMSGWWKRSGQHPLDVFVELIPVNETRNYVKLVLRNYVHYKALRSGGRVEAALIPMQLPAPRVANVAPNVIPRERMASAAPFPREKRERKMATRPRRRRGG